jgi:fucose 4-O-acetylase-like acetyltransferase
MSVVAREVVAPVGPITGSRRSNIVDIVKGLAISLMTYGHTAQGLNNRGWWGGAGSHFSNAFIYSFHMPAFFFVSGLFVMSSIKRRGVRNFTVEKLKTILYPYFLWAILYAVLEPVITQFKQTHHPFHLKLFVISLFEGEQGWFLSTLFLCMMVAVLTRKLPGWLRVLLAVAAGVLTPSGVVFGTVAHEFCFMAAGMWVGSRIHVLDRIHAGMAALILLALAAFQAAMILHFGEAKFWDYILLGLSGTAGLCMLARLIDLTKLGDGFAWVGRASLGVFLVGAFVQGTAREILLRVFHTREFWLHLFVPAIASTIVPAIIWYQQDRLRVGWLFHWPSRKTL